MLFHLYFCMLLFVFSPAFAANWNSQSSAKGVTEIGGKVLTKDVVSGGTVTFKPRQVMAPYAVQIVDAANGHPVLTGTQAVRFEVRAFDCNERDCDDDRGRSEFKILNQNGEKFTGEWWYRFSFYIPTEYQNVFPAKVVLGQFHTGFTPPFTFNGQVESDALNASMFTLGETSYWVQEGVPGDGRETDVRMKGYYSGANTNSKTIVMTPDEMLGRWVQITVHANWTEKADGFFRTYVNRQLRYEFEGRTLPNAKQVSFDVGVYRGMLSRYSIVQAIAEKDADLLKCLAERRIHANVASRPLHSLQRDTKLLIAINGSGCLTEELKSRYPVPTQVVYYDDIVVSKEPLLSPDEMVVELWTPSTLTGPKAEQGSTLTQFKRAGYLLHEEGFLVAEAVLGVDLSSIKPFKIEEPSASGTVKYRYDLKGMKDPEDGYQFFKHPLSVFVSSDQTIRVSLPLKKLFKENPDADKEWQRVSGICGTQFLAENRIEIPVGVGYPDLTEWFQCFVLENNQLQLQRTIQAALLAGQELARDL